jgi:hypothetical protein
MALVNSMALVKGAKLSALLCAALFILSGCINNADELTGNTTTSEPQSTPEPEPTPEPQPTPEPEPILGAATLSWTAPLTRENGESIAMGELDGYEVRYGQTNDISAMPDEITINLASTMEVTVEGLGKGIWYFTIRTLDVNGAFSDWSIPVSKKI